MTLSVIVPVYNEELRVVEALTTLLECDFVDEVVVVDDGSTDNSRALIEECVVRYSKLRLISLNVNHGKGKAIRTALEYCTKEVIAIHDADLEYDPRELAELQKPIILGRADVVFGSRFLGSQPKRVLFYWHSLGNKFLTTLSNSVSNLNLTDMETCHKVFRRSLILKIKLNENRFGIEPEMTIKFARAGAVIYEIGVSYQGRTYKDGKKIGWKDGFSAIYCIVKYAILPKKLWLS
jgi:glycosyltransferase involved in cell wall biosynthesis